MGVTGVRTAAQGAEGVGGDHAEREERLHPGQLGLLGQRHYTTLKKDGGLSTQWFGFVFG